MKHIQKSQEPTCLTELKKQEGTVFGDLNKNKCKKKVRVALLAEQGYICAYCMQRIFPIWNKALAKYKTEIEHWASQDRHPKLVLDYRNMLAVCNGNADSLKRNLICDKSKAKFDKTDDLTINPLTINKINQLEYLPNGEITSKNEQIKRDLNLILNLNEETLQERRAQLYDETRKKMRKIKTKYWNNPKAKKSELQKLKSVWEQRYKHTYKDEEGKEIVVSMLKELCRIPLYLIEKELAKK